MFDRFGIRYKIALVWVIAFLCLWAIFIYTFDKDTMRYQLDNIERSIESNNWDKANEYASKFNNTFAKKRYIIHINNSTEILTTFEYTIGELIMQLKTIMKMPLS